MLNSFILCVVLTLFGALGGYFFKKASSTEKFLKIFINPFLYVGGISYLIGAIMNIIVLKKLDYVVALPLTSLTYVWSAILSYVLLKENITTNKKVGLFMIIIGTLILGINN